MAYPPIIIFSPCCEDSEFVFISYEVPGLPSGYYVYTGPPNITGTYYSGTAGSNQLINGQCYFIDYDLIPTLPSGTASFSATGLTPLDFDNSATYFPDPESGCDAPYCISQCLDPPPPLPTLNNTVTFTPCCEPGEGIIFIDTAPLLSTNLVNGATYLYNYLPGISGQALGSLGINTLVQGQCYTLTFGSSTTVYPTLPSGLTNTTFLSAGNSCFTQTCVDACNPITPEPTNNRYLQYVPCCTNSGPTLYFRVPGINVPIDGVASYVGTINSNPYPTTDINCNPTTSLVSNKCYSITLHTVGVGEPVSTVTQYNCLALAPQDISGNYIWYSPTSPGYYNSSCQTYINTCPDCNPLCFTLWSCDGSQPLFTTSTDLTAFVGIHITVSSVDPEDNIVDLCVFVQNTTQFNCINAIEVTVTSNSCICDCTCYTVTGNIKSIEYINCFGNYVLIPDPGVSTSTFCAQTYPIVFVGDNVSPIIINNGDCIESTFVDSESCEEVSEYVCTSIACYLLEDCNDGNNIIYSNSPSLALPANLEQVVTIVGHTECWKVLPSEICDCPINVTVLTTSSCCGACLPNINYKLTLCEDSLTFVYTSNDLSLYTDKVVRREDCPGCWQVTQIDGNIPTDINITVIEDYLDCELCNRKYYLLEDCLGLELDIITYTDLSEHVDKVITLEWCPETCWRVTETIEDDGAGIISDILNSYNECFDCLTNAPCICSTIKNYNDITLSYKYLDCESHLQTITLQPNQKSDRLCLIRWYAPEPCDELIVTITSSVGVVSNIILYQSSAIHPGPVIVNDKPTWKDAGNTLYVYYDGAKWILSKNLTPLVLPFVYTPIGFITCNGDCDCPTGTWQQSSSIPNQNVYITTELKYTIEYFGNCINGICPPIKNKQKSVTPGYNTPGCEAWKYEEISCRAADAMYKQVLELRYGISNCCPEEDEQYIVQKELIDLAALNDPTYPCSTNSCGCNNNCNCSTAEPVCPPIPLTYNCFCTHTGCECIERGDGSGEYSTLALCQTSCVPIPVTYNCVNNNCTNPGDGSGEYLTLEACEEECQPVTTYNCTNGSCVPVSGPLGEFPTLQDCEDECQPVTSYNCVYGNCVLVSGSSGEYPTLQACQIDCSPPPVTSYNCTDCECISVSGSGGNFPTLQDCIDAGCSDTFITIWETTTAGESITLPYYLAGTYTGTINWGDSTTSANSFATSTHIYATPGIYTVTICGTTNGWNFGATPASAAKITSVVTWGQLTLGNDIGGYFNNCSNLDLSSVSDTLDLTGITNMSYMFFVCTSLTTINYINSWNTSSITSMLNMFAYCSAFNQPLTFNTSAVTTMQAMFNFCIAFNSLVTFSSTAAVTNMSAMFQQCIVFNQPLSFNTAAVTNMSQMFTIAQAFNQPLSFNTAAVTNMFAMFLNCTNFNQPLPWNTGLVQDMGLMLSGAPAFQQDISSWDISNVTNFGSFMNGKTPATWSTTNFDLLLCGWSFQTVNPNLIIDFGSAEYTNLIGAPCHSVLSGAPNLWNIFDGGGI